MKTDDLLDALGEADPTYIQEAEDVRYLGARKKHFMQMAACVALLLIGGSYGIWQQYESTARTDMAKTESAETAEAYDTAVSDGAVTSDAAAPDGTAESAEEYEAAAQSTAGDGNGIQEAAQPESAAGIDWYFNEVEELQTSIACGAEAAKTVSLTEEQLQNYYGIKVIPDAIPDGYVQTDEEKTYQIGYDADGNVIDNDYEAASYAENSEAGEVTSDDIGLLAALIYCEAGSDDYDSMLAMGQMVMDCVYSTEYPDTVSEVIYQSGLFASPSNGALSDALVGGVPSACYEAAAAVMA